MNVTSRLTDVGEGAYAYLASSGSWGWSNAGLVTDGESAMLVDTLFTLDLTQEMLNTMRRAVPAAGSIQFVVNSHADADHTWGNQLVADAHIIATQPAGEDMPRGFTPARLQQLLRNAGDFGLAGEYIERIFSPFNFSGIELTLPTTTFAGTLELTVGDKRVHLTELGPAHSRGDLIVHVPQDRVAFVGDLLFVGGHPPVWAGPLSNWIAACDRILGLDVDVIVPGHGQLTDKAGMTEFRDYLVYVQDEATRLYGLGRTVAQAAREIDLAPYASWGDAERIIVAVDTMYRELDHNDSPPEQMPLFSAMGELMLEASSGEVNTSGSADRD